MVNQLFWNIGFVICLAMFGLTAFRLGKKYSTERIIAFLGSIAMLLGTSYFNILAPNTDFEKTMECSDLPMVYFDKESKVVWANNAYSNLLNRPISSLEGMNINEIINIAASNMKDEDVKSFIEEQLSFIDQIKLQKELHPVTTTRVFHTKSNKTLQLWVHADALINDGKLAGTLVIMKPEN